MTIEYIEVEQTCTKNLCKDKKAFEDTVRLFEKNTILLTSDSNQELLEHLKKVVAISVGRILADRVPGARFLKNLLKNHYEHPNSDLERKNAVIFVKKPQYLHEMKNSEMIEICRNLQLEFLELTAEHVANKESFLSDLKLVQEVDSDIIERKEAEKRIHREVLEAGEFIGHGDQLTFQKFYDAKRLSQSGVTSIEKLEYLSYFRLGKP